MSDARLARRLLGSPFRPNSFSAREVLGASRGIFLKRAPWKPRPPQHATRRLTLALRCALRGEAQGPPPPLGRLAGRWGHPSTLGLRPTGPPRHPSWQGCAARPT
eukprot:scaffold93294_cov27-Tisochrysis_lutea.AAC.3